MQFAALTWCMLGVGVGHVVRSPHLVHALPTRPTPTPIPLPLILPLTRYMLSYMPYGQQCARRMVGRFL